MISKVIDTSAPIHPLLAQRYSGVSYDPTRPVSMADGAEIVWRIDDIDLGEGHTFRSVLAGAFEVSERTLRQVLVPRMEVMSIPAESDVSGAFTLLLDSGHSRAPVIASGNLDAEWGSHTSETWS